MRNKTPDLYSLRMQLVKIQKSIEAMDKDMEEMRSYYRHQDPILSSASESAILSWENVKEIVHVIDYLDGIENFEEIDQNEE